MAWVRLDDKRALNAKLRAAGFAARGLDEAAICWSAHEESDGFVSDADVAMLASLHGCKKPSALTDALVREGRWTRNDTRGGWDIKDYLKFNPSHAELEASRRRDRDRKRRRAESTSDSAWNPDGRNVES